MGLLAMPASEMIREAMIPILYVLIGLDVLLCICLLIFNY